MRGWQNLTFPSYKSQSTPQDTLGWVTAPPPSVLLGVIGVALEHGAVLAHVLAHEVSGLVLDTVAALQSLNAV